MARSRRKKGGGGGGGQSSIAAPLIASVFGGVSMLAALIMFAIGIGQLDTAYTAAATYTEQVGLTDIMGVFGMVIFLLFIGVGLAGLTAGGYMGYKRSAGGGWNEIFMGIVMGTVALVIALILNTIVQGQLNTAYVAANATVNLASFPGMLDIMTVFGMVIFISFIGSGAAAVIGSGVGAYKKLKGGM